MKRILASSIGRHEDVGDKKGVVYVGHMPIGFEEDEMRQYFKQFGKVRRLKISRTPKSGKSKGYAFIQFEDESVAKIAADSMNNYIMFRKCLKAQLLEPEKVHKTLFKGTSKEFVHSKSRKRAIAQLNQSPTEANMKRSKAKRGKAMQRLEELGYKLPPSARISKTRKIPPKKSSKLASASERKEERPSPSQVLDSPSPSIEVEPCSTSPSRPESLKELPSPVGSAKTPQLTDTGSSAAALSTGKNKKQKLSLDASLSQTQSKSTTPESTNLQSVSKNKATNSGPASAKTSKTSKPAKKLVVTNQTPEIISDGSAKNSSEGVTFEPPSGKTPKRLSGASAAKKVYPKTPVPRHKPSPADSEGLKTPAPTVSLKKAATTGLKSGEKLGTTNTKVRASDASPVLLQRSKRTKRESVAAPTTPKAKTPKFSPRVTRSVAKNKTAPV